MANLLNNPEYCSLFEQKAVAFNKLAERLEGLNIPRQTYKELISGLYELEGATESLTRFENLSQFRTLFHDEMSKLPGTEAIIETINNNGEGQING